MRACVGASERASERASVRACVRACVRVCVYVGTFSIVYMCVCMNMHSVYIRVRVCVSVCMRACVRALFSSSKAVLCYIRYVHYSTNIFEFTLLEELSPRGAKLIKKTVCSIDQQVLYKRLSLTFVVVVFPLVVPSLQSSRG